jgi:hypothetical protein
MHRFSQLTWLACFGCGLLFATASLARAQAPTDDQALKQTLDKLVEQLGHQSYAVREEAMASILKIGLPALPRMEQEIKNADLEIRYRCDQLRFKLVDVDLQKRFEAFAADVKGEKDHKLELWDRFTKLYDGTPPARALFAEMYQAEPKLMKALLNDPQNFETNVVNRAMLLQYDFQGQKVRVGTLALLMFAGADEKVKLNMNAQQMMLNACYQPSIQEAMNNAEKREVMKKVMSRFILRAEGWAAHQAMSLAAMYNLPEGLQLARKIVKSPEQPHMLMAALPIIAKQGDKEDIPELEELLDNKTVIMNMQINNQRIQGQVRDSSLVTLLHLLSKDKARIQDTIFKDGDIKAFGFDRLELNPTQVFAPHTVGFAEEPKREAVFKKWAELKQQLSAKDAPKK